MSQELASPGVGDSPAPRVSRLAVLETPHRFGEVKETLALVKDALEDSRENDLVLLPEMALTGYVSASGSFDLAPFAEALEGETHQRLAALARAHHIYLAAPLVERAGQNIFNTLILLGPDGARLGHYRKRHPWYPETWATPGDLGHPLVRIGAFTFTFAICFDLHFLGDEAKASLDAADWLLFPSAWVEDGEEQRQPLLQALARTHALGVVNANWGRGVPAVGTQGRSLILDARGDVVAETTRGESGPRLLAHPLR